MLDIKLDRDIDIRVYEFARKVGKEILERNKDLDPQVRFLFTEKHPEQMTMTLRNEDAATFFSQLEYHINNKFVLETGIDARIYYLLLHELGVLIKK
jgi:hypothetical protein